jgi:hypothetical protein
MVQEQQTTTAQVGWFSGVFFTKTKVPLRGGAEIWGEEESHAGFSLL